MQLSKRREKLTVEKGDQRYRTCAGCRQWQHVELLDSLVVDVGARFGLPPAQLLWFAYVCRGVNRCEVLASKEAHKFLRGELGRDLATATNVEPEPPE